MEAAPVLSLAVSPQFATDRTLVAGTESNGLMISRDAGSTWQPISTPDATEPVNAILLSPRFPEDSAILVMVSDRLFASQDLGNSWSPWQGLIQGLPCWSAWWMVRW
jgi:hypothetical protein